MCPMQQCEMELNEDEKLYCLYCNLREITKGKAWQDRRRRSRFIAYAVFLDDEEKQPKKEKPKKG